MSETSEIEERLDMTLLLSESDLESKFYRLLSTLSLCPGSKHLLKTEIQDTLAVWGRILESKGLYAKLFSSYEQALQIFSDHEGILTNLGAHLLRAGYLENASTYFKQALEINKDYIPAIRNLECVFNLWIERWHFRMLNDSTRNSHFREAIMKKVKQGFNTVLDIGTGTGLLSLFAVEAGAQEIYACDDSKTMIEIAELVLNHNNAKGKVKLINKLSNDIEIPSDIPHRLSLVITETLDVGLLGENILQTLIHAWDVLLLPFVSDHNVLSTTKCCGGCVIPNSASVWVAAVECKYIDLKYRFQSDKFISGMNRSGDGRSVFFTNFVKFNLFAMDDQEYDSIDLEKLPGGFRFLSSPYMAIEINFNDRNCLEQLYLGTFKKQFDLLCKTSGQVDAFVVWFDLHLDEDIVLSSAPIDVVNRAKCWDQAVFPSQTPIDVTNNEILKLRLQCTNGKLTIEYHSNLKEPGTSKSLQDDKCNSKNGSNIKHDHTHQNICRVSPEIVSYLNDQEWISCMSVVAELSFNRNQSNGLKILDLSPIPMLGMTFLLHKQKLTGIKDGSLTCVVQEQNDTITLSSLIQNCGIHEQQICILSGELDEVLDGNQKFDYIIYPPVDAFGKLNEKYITYLSLFSDLKTRFGHIFPTDITICCQIIHSSWLQEVSEVLEERVCGFYIAPFMNKFKVSEHQDVLLSTLQHVTHSNVVETQPLNLKLLMKSLKEPLLLKMCTDVTTSGLVNAIPYWFKIKLFKNHEVTTFSPSSFSNQCVILLDTPLYVNAGERVCINVICHQGLLHATVMKEIEA